jgi:hypothetical protein
LEPQALHEILASLPIERASGPAKLFAQTMVLSARTTLMDLLK